MNLIFGFFLANYLSKLTFTEEGNPKTFDDSDIINIGRYKGITALIEEIEKIQAKGYQFAVEPDDEIIGLITNPSYRVASSEHQYELSLVCEASNRTQPSSTHSVRLDEPIVTSDSPVPAIRCRSLSDDTNIILEKKEDKRSLAASSPQTLRSIKNANPKRNFTEIVICDSSEDLKKDMPPNNEPNSSLLRPSLNTSAIVSPRRKKKRRNNEKSTLGIQGRTRSGSI